MSNHHHHHHQKANTTTTTTTTSTTNNSSSMSSYHVRFVCVTLVVYHGLYLLLRYLFEQNYTHSVLGWKRHCDSSQTNSNSNNFCQRSDLFAFQFLSGTIFIVIAALAVRSWKTLHHTHHHNHTHSPETRLFGHDTHAELLTLINFAYQLWDFAVSWTIPEHCTLIMMTHHTVAAILAFSAIYNDMMHYYATFFLGLSEVSSIFLVSVDVAKYFEPGTILDRYVQPVSGPLFAATFLYFRVWRWWPVSKQLLDDVRVVTKKSGGTAQLLRPGRSWILYMWLVFNLPMGLLQLYWTTIIYHEAKGVLGM